MYKLPFGIVKFWYLEAPRSLFLYFLSLNKYFFNLFSIPLMIRTFFKPWKNEYRDGLVRFSIFMGIAIKSIFIIIGLFIFSFLLLFEIFTFVIFLVLPIAVFYLPFIKI